MSKQEEFCSNCGCQVYAKEEEYVKSKWDIMLRCDTCEEDIHLLQTISLITEYWKSEGNLNGEVKSKYILMPSKEGV